MISLDSPPAWERSAETIRARGWRTILVLGATDCGKSTYCAFLSDHLLKSGSRVALVDADIGQKDIGPPGCLTLGYPKPSMKPADLRPAGFYFVGAVSPARHLLPMVVGTRQLLDAARAAFVIINTTGMIHGIGRVLKSYKIEAVKPDVIVAIQRGEELGALLRAYRNHRIIRLRPSPLAAMKTPDQRRSAREKAFADYFRSAELLSLDFKKLIVQRSLLFTGRPIQGSEFVYGEKTSEGIVVVGKDADGQRADRGTLPLGFERNLLCGVANQANSGQGLAILHEIDFARQTVSLLTPVPPQTIKILQLGDLYITKEGREPGRLR